MCSSECLSSSEREELISFVTGLQEQVLQFTVANEELLRQLAESQRNGRRQAAPLPEATYMGSRAPGRA